MTFSRDSGVIKGTVCQGQVIPLEPHRSSTGTFSPVTYIFPVSVNSISRFICKAPEKAVIQWHRLWELSRSEQGSSNQNSSVGNKNLLKAERKRRNGKLKRNQKISSAPRFDSTDLKKITKLCSYVN